MPVTIKENIAWQKYNIIMVCWRKDGCHRTGVAIWIS